MCIVVDFRLPELLKEEGDTHKEAMTSVASNMNHTYITQYGRVPVCTTEAIV